MDLRTVMNIEVSSLCDNKCPYCPAQKQKEHREVGLMTMETFMKSMKVVEYCVKKGTQTELNLFGIGEPTLNPKLVEMVKYARDHLPPRIELHLNTNGNRMTLNYAKSLKDAGITHVDVTGHEPLVAAKAVVALKHHRIYRGLSRDFIEFPNTWAGQVEWLEPDYEVIIHVECPWLKKGQVMITWDGKLATCCMDAFGRGVVGTVDDDLDKINLKEYELCKTCHHMLTRYRQLSNGTVVDLKGGPRI